MKFIRKDADISFDHFYIKYIYLVMLPNFKILAFFLRQFYSIAFKKKLLLTYPSFFPHRSRNQEKREENELRKI